jgi:hypothetical protein
MGSKLISKIQEKEHTSLLLEGFGLWLARDFVVFFNEIFMNFG